MECLILSDLIGWRYTMTLAVSASFYPNQDKSQLLLLNRGIHRAKYTENSYQRFPHKGITCFIFSNVGQSLTNDQCLLYKEDTMNHKFINNYHCRSEYISKGIAIFCIFYHWKGRHWKTSIHLIFIVRIMVASDLVTEGTEAAVVIVLARLSRNYLI